MPRLHISNGKFYDEHDREVILRGINVDGNAKNPAKPNQPSHEPAGFFDGDSVSFINRPFSLEAAPSHFARLRRWGYTTIRWIFTWEALEHAGPGNIDQDFIAYTVKCLRIAKDYHFMVIMDPHQDVWSRFSGGSGAPLWTLYACGLDPRKFLATEASLVQNTWPVPAEMPKMIWATNYYRLTCQVMFTLFWAGKEFAPFAIINGQNIQEYLQDHFVNAIRSLLQAIANEGDLLDDVVIGWESFNEPNRGLIGIQDISVVPTEQKLQKGTSPTAWQAALLGSGIACEVETWDVGDFGPHKTGTALVDPNGESVWLQTDDYDHKYGWKRSPHWELGRCLWSQCGIWDRKTDTLLKPDYFAKDPRNNESIDYPYFTNHWFMDHFRRYRDLIREIHGGAIVFCQSPTLEIPPSLKGTADEESNIVFCPHWYDGLTLMTKTWKWWNVDIFGLLRGRYSSPVFAIKIGQSQIRNCFRDQLAAMRQEGLDQMGQIPTVFTETGMPFDLNAKKAYEDGDYSSQVTALDAVHYGLERSGVEGYTLWNYTSTNNHEWGDQWNGEDLSIFSLDDPPPPTNVNTGSQESSTSFGDTSSPSFSKASSLEQTRETPSTLNQTLNVEAMSPVSSSLTDGQSSPPEHLRTVPDRNAFRAASAHIRPWPRGVHEKLVSFGFDLKTSTFTLSLTSTTPTPQSAPTEIFLPNWHYPPTSTAVEVSGGKWEIVAESIVRNTKTISDDGETAGTIQVLKWWHAEGEQKITVKGMIRSASIEGGADGTYMDLYRGVMDAWNCSVM